jgi:hypothetical protein
MLIEFTCHADKDYSRPPKVTQRQVDKQLALLQQNVRHPSIDSKKYGGTDDVWQGRVNRNYRFYFRNIGDTCRILTIIPHPK